VRKIVFATHNKNKLKEVQALFSDNITVLSLSDIGCYEEIPETAETIEENAILKADFITSKYGYSCFADDTGLLVDALNGAPGVYSARYAGEHKNAEDNMDKLLDALDNKNNRAAKFKTVIALNLNGSSYLFEGIIEGEITHGKRGQSGFGYDPIFKPNGLNQTFAELPLETKNKIGHRGKAIQQLLKLIRTLPYEEK